ncbi:MAG: dihydrolipoamide acetyltransferase family protein [Thermoleophilia bacterium]
MTTFRLPDLGEGLTEAELLLWHVGPGDLVVEDQPLLVVVTGKAQVEIPSPLTGRVTRLLANEGDWVPVGEPLLDIDTDAEPRSTDIVGRPPEARPARAPAPADAPTRVSPAVRAVARELGVDLQGLVGSGPGGALQAEDVRNAAARAAGSRSLDGVRRGMAQVMARAGDAAVATVVDDADVDHWDPSEDHDARLVCAMVRACRVVPALNAWFDPSTQSRTLHPHIDIAVVFDGDGGPYVPVLRDAGARPAAELREELAHLRSSRHHRRARIDQLGRATITLLDFGEHGGRYATPMVIPPQVATLGVGRLAPRVVAIAGEPRVHRLLPLSLSIDHRVVSGGEATRFLTAVIEALERPEIIPG